MILVRELLNDCDPRNPPYTFPDRYPCSIHRSRWFFALDGYYFGSVFMWGLTWLLDEIATFSGDSSLKLFVCLFAIIGADAYFEQYCLSPSVHHIAPDYKSSCLLIVTVMTWYSVKHAGTFHTMCGIAFVSSLIRIYNATVDFEIMLQRESSPPNSYKWKMDKSYALVTSYKVNYPLRELGFAIGFALKLVVPIKVIFLWIAFYWIYFFKELTAEKDTGDDK